MEAGTPTSQPPISAELWQRLKALDRRCDISMRRDDQWLVPGAGKRMVWGMGGSPCQHRRAWHVRIHLRGSIDFRHMLDTASVRLTDALLSAVEEAERRGWHRPPGL